MVLRSDDRYRVMVVDESPATRGGVRAALEGLPNLEVVGDAGDLVSGVGLATQLEPDLILFDPAAGNGDAAAGIREILASVPDATLVVYGEDEARESTALEAGAHAYLSKHASTAQLVTTLLAVAAQHSGRSLGAADAEGELHRLAFEAMTDGVVFQDRAGRIVYANEAAQQILGRSAADLLGENSTDPHWGAVHPDGSPWPGKEHPAIEAMRTQEPVREVVMGVLTSGANRRWLSVTATPVSRAGVPLGVLVAFADVTEQHDADVARREADARFRIAIDRMLDGFLILRAARDGDRITDFVYEFANQAVEFHAGYRPEELVGRRLLEIAPSLGTNGAFQRYVEAVESGEPIVMDVPYSDGPRVQGAFEVRGVPLGDGLALTVRNVTQRKLAEAKPRETVIDATGAVLTTRELEVLTLLGEGVSTREISERLFISLNTARNHVQRVIVKLGAHSRLEAVAIARRAGVLASEPARG